MRAIGYHPGDLPIASPFACQASNDSEGDGADNGADGTSQNSGGSAGSTPPIAALHAFATLAATHADVAGFIQLASLSACPDWPEKVADHISKLVAASEVSAAASALLATHRAPHQAAGDVRQCGVFSVDAMCIF